jgi:hypothetical protein
MVTRALDFERRVTAYRKNSHQALEAVYASVVSIKASTRTDYTGISPTDYWAGQRMIGGPVGAARASARFAIGSSVTWT